MTLFYGLGNNENIYLNTKHNIGRIIVENLAQKYELNFNETKNYSFAKNLDFCFVFSNGYMNNIGEPLAEFLKYYKVDITQNFDLVVMQDDSDQIVGSSKLSLGGGTAGHKGIISIYEQLENLGFESSRIWRLKIGIRPEGNKLKSETFVLNKNCSELILNASKISNLMHQNLDLFKTKNFSNLQKLINTKS